MTTATKTLPHWDMTSIFPSLSSPEFEAAFQSVVDTIDDLNTLFDRYDVAQHDPVSLDNATLLAFDDVLQHWNAFLDHYRTVSAYIHSFLATNTRDNLAQTRFSELQGQSVRVTLLGNRLTAWIGSLDLDALIARSKQAADHAYFLHRTQESARHMMSPAEETLAAELYPSGGGGWEKLHSSYTSQIIVPVDSPDGTKDLPMSMVRNLAFDPDRDVRRRAYEAELAAWKRSEVPVAAALNGVKGESITLSSKRGWPSVLDETIFDSNIDRQTLDAMMEAAHESFPDFRRYLKAKARALGLPVLSWYDIFAPVGEAVQVWEYGDATRFIVEQFGSYSGRLGDFAARAFRENWVDAEPRPGKRDGAFCMAVRLDESRVFTNFKSSYGGMSTLAHELGHGYHNMNKADRTSLQKATPMTLAETASIFCETIVRHAALKDATPAEQLYILEASLQDSCQVVVDITSRFLFEGRAIDKRRERELTSDEFCALMLDAQRETYGDGLDQNALHPFMWAVKPHYYRVGLAFYNFPYMFGLLFGLGLYAQYKQDPEPFKRNYDDLLSSTGLDDAAGLASRFGIDIRTTAFWRSSLDIIRADIDKFEGLVSHRS
ncbi:MAG TPA: M3 family oligoendopeptidase [Chloroflexia bacterium]|nr:M3 family oligoendopeptidase [Chloroflexia bacterium]